MSLTRQLDSTAQDYKYGLLASKLSALLSRKSGSPISEPDHKDIEAAIGCVRDHLHGAQVLYSGMSIAGVTAGSIRSLGFALNPLEKLIGNSAPSDKVIIDILSEIEKALVELGELTEIPAQTGKLILARNFFSLVADSLLSSINHSRMPRSHAVSL
jgi:hypothetical protein